MVRAIRLYPLAPLMFLEDHSYYIYINSCSAQQFKSLFKFLNLIITTLLTAYSSSCTWIPPCDSHIVIQSFLLYRYACSARVTFPSRCNLRHWLVTHLAVCRGLMILLFISEHANFMERHCYIDFQFDHSV